MIVTMVQYIRSDDPDCYRSAGAARSRYSTSVPFLSMHQSVRAHGGPEFGGSLPASLSRSATTPCAGTACAVKLRIAVPLSVWVQRSCGTDQVCLCGVREAAREARTRTEYWRPARIQGDSVRLKNMSAGSSSVLIWGARTAVSRRLASKRGLGTHEHEDGTVLALAAPVLRRVRGVAHPIGLSGGLVGGIGK